MTCDKIAGAILVATIAILMLIFSFVKKKIPEDKDMARKVDEDIKTGKGTAVWLKGTYKFLAQWLGWLVSFAEKPLEKLSPNVITFIGAAFCVISGVFYSINMLNIACLFLILGGIADAADGRIARRRGEVSKVGAFIDSVSDRVSEVVIFLGIMLGPFYGSANLQITAALAMSLSLLVSYTRARGESLGVKCGEGFMRRQERLTVLAVCTILESMLPVKNIFLGIGICLIATGSLITSAMRIKDIIAQMRG